MQTELINGKTLMFKRIPVMFAGHARIKYRVAYKGAGAVPTKALITSTEMFRRGGNQACPDRGIFYVGADGALAKRIYDAKVAEVGTV